MKEAGKSWRKIHDACRIRLPLDGLPFNVRIPAPDYPSEQQKFAA